MNKMKNFELVELPAYYMSLYKCKSKCIARYQIHMS